MLDTQYDSQFIRFEIVENSKKKTLTELVCERENIPRPCLYAIQKVVQGSHHQCHIQHGRSAAMQHTSNVYLEIIFSVVKNVSVWKSYNIMKVFLVNQWL